MGGFNAVVDVLRGLENVVRVLKDGGLGVIASPWELLSDPAIAEIIAATPGAGRLFELKSTEITAPIIRRDYIVINKRKTGRFRGFPFRLVGSKRAIVYENWCRFVRVGIYEPV